MLSSPSGATCTPSRGCRVTRVTADNPLAEGCKQKYGAEIWPKIIHDTSLAYQHRSLMMQCRNRYGPKVVSALDYQDHLLWGTCIHLTSLFACYESDCMHTSKHIKLSVFDIIKLQAPVVPLCVKTSQSFTELYRC